MYNNLLDKEISVWQKTRNPRFVYLIEECCQYNSIILDIVFEESYKRWGGLKTLMIPVYKGNISCDYLSWIKLYDPDIIYSYAILNENIEAKLNKENKPFNFFKHKNCTPEDIRFQHLGSPRNLYNFFRPNYNFQFTEALSFLSATRERDNQQFHRSSFIHYIVGGELATSGNSFIQDNFGLFEQDRAKLAIQGIANIKLLDLRPKSLQYHASSEDERIGIEDLFDKINNGEIVYTPSYLANKNSSYLKVKFTNQLIGLRLFIGDSFHDRVNFWNSRHDYDAKNDLSPYFLSSMIISSSSLEDDKFIEFFKKFIWMHCLQGNYNIQLFSYSIPQEGLEKFQRKLGLEGLAKITETAPFLPIEINTSCLIQEDSWKPFTHYFKKTVQREEFSLEINEPIHHLDLNESPYFLKNKDWVVDLKVERHDNLFYESSSSLYKEIWNLPSSNILGKLFIPKECVRINSQGNISLISFPTHASSESSASRYVDLRLPSDRNILNAALCTVAPDHLLKNDIRQRKKEKKIIYGVGDSDKGESLINIISKFGNLQETYNFTDDPVWREFLNNPRGDYTEFGEGELKKVVYLKANVKGGRDLYINKTINAKLNFLIEKEIILPVIQGGNEQKYKITKATADDFKKCFAELWLLGKLQRTFKGSFLYLPQTDIYYSDDPNDKNEIDIVCIGNRELIIGEAKGSSELFDDALTEKILEIAKLSNADKIILAYERNEGNNVEQSCNKLMSQGFKVEIVKIFSEKKLSWN